MKIHYVLVALVLVAISALASFLLAPPVGSTAIPPLGAAVGATVAPAPPPPDPAIPPVEPTSADAAIRKLSPDLREAARAHSLEVFKVTVLMEANTPWPPYLGNAVPRKPLGDIRWVSGEMAAADLLKLASLPGVTSIISPNAYRPATAPDLEDLRRDRRLPLKNLREAVSAGGKEALRAGIQQARQERPPAEKSERLSLPPVGVQPDPSGARTSDPSVASSSAVQPSTLKVKDIHGASLAWAKGYTGTGVVAAVVDTGVDFAHPDLNGSQARVPSGPYAGWPFAYDTSSGDWYAWDPTETIGPDTFWDKYSGTWYAHTLPITTAVCNGATCTANLKIDFGSDVEGWDWAPVVLPFTWADTSKSRTYYYTVHPDFNLWALAYDIQLGYAYDPYMAPAAVLVVDEQSPGVYDTVYVDLNFNRDFRDDRPMRKGSETAGLDLFNAAGDRGTDGFWDLSAGMLTWIADGANPPPGTGVLFQGVSVPGAGRLLAFLGDEDSHGTSVAGDIVARGVISDPYWHGVTNPYYAGGGSAGGVGGAVLAGMAPGAKVAAFQNGFWFPFDSWTLAILGFDGIPNSGDEAQIVSNSWGDSGVVEDGWDVTSRFAHYLNRRFAPNTAFLVATGNGGHGYGTGTSPGGGSIIDVGASTSYGSLDAFGLVTPSQFTWGDVQPWSNRGPGSLGDVSPDVVAVGAWGSGAYPLNLNEWYRSSTGVYFANGQSAYDMFGGTSMATPIAAGNLALIYQSFREVNGRWPTWQEVKSLLLNSARDLGYDIFAQGSGNVDADRATDIVAGRNSGYWVEPAQWIAGSYRGNEYPAFPAIMHAGGTATKTFTVNNTFSDALSVNIGDTMLTRVGEVTLTISFPAFNPPSDPTLPAWITDVTALIAAYSPDLVRGQVVFPFGVFDSNGNYQFDKNDRWEAAFLDWTDLNGDGNLWTDSDGNGRVDAGEIDINSTTGVYEYNLLTYGAPTGTYLEASVGRDSLSRRHDGVFFGLRRVTSAGKYDEQTAGPDPVTLKVRLTFYRKADWPWLTTSATGLSVPGRGSATFAATMSVPGGTRPGVFEGAIEVSHGPHKHIIPVSVVVAASSATFDFGAISLSEPIGDQPYDNGHLFGGFDWTWRFEAGDWRLFYYDIPNGTAAPGKALIVDTRWVITPTDVDTWVFGSAPLMEPFTDTAFFGPRDMEMIAGSRWRFGFDTASGGPQEIVAGNVRDGLGFLSLRNALNAGEQFGEPFVGRTYTLQATPYPVELTSSSSTGRQEMEVRSTASISEGLAARAYGLSMPILRRGLPIRQDSSACTSSYSTTVGISLAASLLITTASNVGGMDIDLLVYRDNGDGIFGCWMAGDTLEAASTSYSSTEQVRLRFPKDGLYWILVRGYTVPGGSAAFDLGIEAIQGRDLTVVGAPAGAIGANTLVSFSVSYSRTLTPGDWKGVVHIGPPGAPYALEVPYIVHAVDLSGTATLSGSVQLQARGSSPSARWTVPLTVTLHTPGVLTPTYVFTPTTDTSGRFALEGVNAGIYDVRVKKTGSLTSKRSNIILAAGSNSLSLGFLLEGDASNNGVVNSLDYAPLASSYFKQRGNAGYDWRVDFNDDGRVNSSDYAPLASNYFKRSDVEVLLGVR